MPTCPTPKIAIDGTGGNDWLDGYTGTDQCDSDAGDAEVGCEL